MKLKKLNARGFSHDLVLVLFVVIFAIAGVGYLVASHAANACDTESFSSGSNDSCVADIKFLIHLKDPGDGLTSTPNPNFDANTVKAVKQYQSEEGIPQTGTVDAVDAGGTTWPKICDDVAYWNQHGYGGATQSTFDSYADPTGCIAQNTSTTTSSTTTAPTTLPPCPPASAGTGNTGACTPSAGAPAPASTTTTSGSTSTIVQKAAAAAGAEVGGKTVVSSSGSSKSKTTTTKSTTITTTPNTSQSPTKCPPGQSGTEPHCVVSPQQPVLTAQQQKEAAEDGCATQSHEEGAGAGSTATCVKVKTAQTSKTVFGPIVCTQHGTYEWHNCTQNSVINYYSNGKQVEHLTGPTKYYKRCIAHTSICDN